MWLKIRIVVAMEKIRSVLVQTDALVLVALLTDHHVCLIEHEADDVACVYQLVLDEPVGHLSRRPNNDLFREDGTARR